jgi:hypothetical protein
MQWFLPRLRPVTCEVYRTILRYSEICFCRTRDSASPVCPVVIDKKVASSPLASSGAQVQLQLLFLLPLYLFPKTLSFHFHPQTSYIVLPGYNLKRIPSNSERDINSPYEYVPNLGTMPPGKPKFSMTRRSGNPHNSTKVQVYSKTGAIIHFPARFGMYLWSSDHPGLAAKGST